jgi:hypothetical protein
MNEVGVKELIRSAIEEADDGCEVTINPRGLTLEFSDGTKFRVPEPIDVSDDDVDDFDDGDGEE